MQLNVDGEYGGKLPANFLNLNSILKFVRLKIFIIVSSQKIIKVFKK